MDRPLANAYPSMRAYEGFCALQPPGTPSTKNTLPSVQFGDVSSRDLNQDCLNLTPARCFPW